MAARRADNHARRNWDRHYQMQPSQQRCACDGCDMVFFLQFSHGEELQCPRPHCGGSITIEWCRISYVPEDQDGPALNGLSEDMT